MSAYMTTAEAAAYVGNVSPRTIVAWIHSKRLEASRDPSARGRFRITREALDKALAAWSDNDSAQS